MTFDPQGQGAVTPSAQAPDEDEGSRRRPTDALLRRHRGRARLPPLQRQAPLRAGPELLNRNQPRGQAEQRVAKGLDAAYNPLWKELNGKQIGLAGHSYGAVGRVLHRSVGPAREGGGGVGQPRTPGPERPKCRAAPARSSTIGEKGCPADPADRTDVPITKPALGMSADYGLPPTPNTSLPEPLGKSKESFALQRRRRGQRRDHHPRRIPPRLQLHPQPGVRSLATRART